MAFHIFSKGKDIKASQLNENFNNIYPIGSIYMSVNSVNPSTVFGGTWEQIKDTFLLAAGNTYNAGTTGGEATHTLTVEEMPSHAHKLCSDINPDGSNKVMNPESNGTSNQDRVYNNTYSWPNTYNTGGDKPHNNMPPYLTVYMWKRTA